MQELHHLMVMFPNGDVEGCSATFRDHIELHSTSETKFCELDIASIGSMLQEAHIRIHIGGVDARCCEEPRQ